MTDQWTNRVEIRSESSSRIYTLAQRKPGGPGEPWYCSCPSFKSHRATDSAGRTTCKHLRGAGLQGPVEQRHGGGPRRSPTRDSFADDAYRHYDPSFGYGSAEEWARAAEGFAQGYGRYRGGRSSGRPCTSRGPRSSRSDLELLELSEMPADASGVTAAMRRMAFKLHPDCGGNAKDFIAMFDAYKRLLRFYER